MPRLNSLNSSDFAPKKWYPVAESEGKITTLLTPGGARKKRVIYVFKNKRTDELLIGKTSQVVKKRVSQYNTSFNHPEKDYGKGLLPTRVRKNPNDFEFGILHELKAHESLEWWERALIIAFNSIKSGYNQNLGGGGGTGLGTPQKRVSGKRKATILKTPEKYYHLSVDSNGGAQLKLTPTAKKIDEAVYVFKKDGGEKVYIGMTNDFSRRAKEHVAYSRNPHTDKGQMPLPNSIRRSPRRFKVGVLAYGGNLALIEKQLIAEARKTTTVYNQNSGGGGSQGTRPIPARVLKF